MGISLKKLNSTYVVNWLAVNGIAQDAGIELKDIITKSEIRNIHQIHRNWGYVAGIILLIIIVSSQWKRSRQIKSS